MKLLSITNYKNNLKVIFFGIKITINKSLSHRLKKISDLKTIYFSKFVVFFIPKKRVKKYSHIITFGKNCETAKMLNFTHGHIESTLFSWATYNNSNTKCFFEAIKNPDIIFSKGTEFIESANMYTCLATKMSFHGSKKTYELLDKDGNLDPEKYEKEKQDTFDKIKYLAQKNEALYNLPDKKLYLFTLDYNNNEDIDFIKNLKEFLSSKNPNFDMLVIVEKEKYCKELENLQRENKNIFIKTIYSFDKKLDSNYPMPLKYYIDWQIILREFVSTSKNVKKKKLKCD